MQPSGQGGIPPTTPQVPVGNHPMPQQYYHPSQVMVQGQPGAQPQVVVMPPNAGTSGGAVAGIVVAVVVVVVALTVVLAGVLYVWASSLAGDTGVSTGGSLDGYTWDDRDAQGSGNLVEISMTSGQGLNWAVVKITISVDGGTPQNCAHEDQTASCSWSAYQGAGNSQQWEVSEGITISGTCDNDPGCEVDVTITKMGVGSEDDKVVGQILAYADITV